MHLIQNKGLLKKVPKGKPSPSNCYKLWKQAPPEARHQRDILCNDNLPGIDRDSINNSTWYQSLSLSGHVEEGSVSKCTSVCVYEDQEDTLIFKNDITGQVISKTVIKGSIFEFFMSINFQHDGQVVVLYLSETLEVKVCVVVLNKKNRASKKPIEIFWNGNNLEGTLAVTSLIQDLLQEKMFNPRGLKAKEFDYTQLVTESAAAALFSTFSDNRVGSSYITHASKGFNIIQICRFTASKDTLDHGGAHTQKIVINYSFKLAMRNNGNIKQEVWMPKVKFSLTDSEVSLAVCDGKIILSSVVDGSCRICLPGFTNANHAFTSFDEPASISVNFKLPMLQPYSTDRRLIAAGRSLYVCSNRQIYVYNDFDNLFARAFAAADVMPVRPALQWHQNVTDRYSDSLYGYDRTLPAKKSLQSNYMGNFKNGKEIDLGVPRHLLELDEKTVAIHLCKLFEPGAFEVLVFASYLAGSEICTAIHAVCAGKVIFKNFILGNHVKSIVDFKFTKANASSNRDAKNVIGFKNLAFEVSGVLTVQLDNGNLVRFDVLPDYDSSCVFRDLDREATESENMRLSTPGRRLVI